MMMMSGNFTPESRCLHVTSRAGLGVEICEGSWQAHKPLAKRKQHRNTGADKREKVLIARVSRIIDQAALTLLPKGFAETVP